MRSVRRARYGITLRQRATLKASDPGRNDDRPSSSTDAVTAPYARRREHIIDPVRAAADRYLVGAFTSEALRPDAVDRASVQRRTLRR
jgi:hypothetical protein